MNLTKLTLNNSRITLIAVLLVAILGVSNYFVMERDSMPPYTVRFASVVTRMPGASPLEVESLVTDPLEEVIRELAQVKSIMGESREGLSVITVELSTDVGKKELDGVWMQLRNKVEDAAMTLPPSIVGPVVKDDGIGDVYGIILGVTSDGVGYDVLEDYAKQVRDELLLLPDVAKVKMGGVQQERIYINFDDKVLALHGLDLNTIKNVISATNVLVPAGEVSAGKERIAVEGSGSFGSLEELEKVLLPVQGGSLLYLGDIAESISREYVSPREKLVKINGKPAIALFLSLRDGANIVRMGQDADRVTEQLNKNLPLGIEVVRSASQDHVVNGQIGDFLVNLVQSIVIVLGVMLLFLGVRTGSLVATLVPVVILTSFFFLGLLGLGFNKVSLAALIISLGLLVDNGIVVSESILVKIKEGMGAFDAAVTSGRELLVPLLISSLTTSAAFLPFALAATPMGEISSQLFWVVSATLLGSWVLSFTLIPMLAVYVAKTGEGKKSKWSLALDNYIKRFNLWYNKLLLFLLERPFKLLSVIAVLFVLAVVSIRFIPFKLVPDSDRNLVTVDINFPSGMQIENTVQAVDIIGAFIDSTLLVKQGSKMAGVLDYSAFVGEGPEPYDLGYFKNEAKAGYAHMLLNTTGDKDNDLIIGKVSAFCEGNIPDADIRVNRLTGAGASGTPVEIRVSGDNPEKLRSIANQIKMKLREVQGAVNITDDWGPMTKKLFVDIDAHKAARAGLTSLEASMALNAGMSGVPVDEFRDSDKRVPVYLRGVQSVGSDEQGIGSDVRKLEGYTIYSARAQRAVGLQEIAQVKTVWQYPKIIRRELERTITVGAYLKPGYNAADIFEQTEPWIEEQSVEWGNGYSYQFGGEDEDTAENLGAIFVNLPLALFLIVLLLVLQFNSIRKMTIIVISIPLGIIGVVVGWFIGGSFVSFFGVLGVIALAGIVVNNAIILIDRIDIEIANDGDAHLNDVIVRAAHNRFRPVLLTTLTTSLGMLPLWFSGDLLWEPLALAIIFGLLFATVITLLYVPVLYKLFFKKIAG
ncbi:MAG: efflux RND transporter permease subunit [Bacteroidales bacterium]|nr:efflux RND transporter permease subunit [Bacteroidales bacterium]